jgi:molybdenum cofactor cytidylyltransferase
MIAALVLAAGLSRRMGRQKLLLDVEGKPVLRWSVEGVLGHVDDTLVVTGPDDATIRAALQELPVRFAVNPRPEDGQGSSIAAGVAALAPGTRAVIVTLGDQPRLPPDVVPALLDTFHRSGKPIVAPVYRGTQGTPVVFAAEVFGELARLTGDAGAKRVVRRDASRVALVPFDVVMPCDVDTPEDYARLHERTRKEQVQ